MKIIITNEEFIDIKKTLKSIDTDIYNALLDSLKNTSAISYNLHPTKEIEIEINKRYVKDTCNVYYKYFGIIISNIKSIIKIIKLFIFDVNTIDKKYDIKQ